MQKKVVWIFVGLLLITACSRSEGDLPPDPVPPVSEPDAQIVRNLAGQATYPFEVGFSSPNDVYEEDAAKQQLFFIDKPDVNYLSFQEDTFTFPVKVKHRDGVVYKYGYVYTKSKGWERYEFPQTTYRGSNWIVEQADVTLNLNRNEFDEGDNWAVAYSCRKIAGRWRCGMQEKDGAGGVWMLQRFTVRNTGTPAEPNPLQPTTPPGVSSTAMLTISKTGTGSITSTSTPIQTDQINCGTDCTADYPSGTSVTLTAAPTSGATVTWSESGCTGNTCVVTTGTTAKTVTATFTAAVAGAPTFVVCRVPLRDTPDARPAHLTGANDVTDANAEEKCAALAVFGKADGTAFTPLATADLDAAGSLIENVGQSNEKLVCALSCATGRNVITACKDIAADPGTMANPYYRPVVSGCS